MNTLQVASIEETSLSNNIFSKFFYDLKKRLALWAVILIATWCVLLFLAYITSSIEVEEFALLGDITTATILGVAVILAWRVTRHPMIDNQTRRAWQMLMLAIFSYTAGDWLWLFYSKIIEIEPFPSWADLGYLSFYPLMLWALLRIPAATAFTRSEKAKIALDVGIVMLGTTIVVWHFIIGPTLATITDDEWLNPVLAVAYVIGDMVMQLGIFTVLMRGVSATHRRLMYILLFGLLSFSFADLGFAYLTVQETFYSGHWIDWFWVLGDLAMLFVAYFQYNRISQADSEEIEANEEREVNSFSWLPYLAIAVGSGMLLYASRPYWSEPIGLIVFLSLAITILVVCRQITAVKENIRFHSEAAARRTEFHFRSLVQNSSDLITIIDFDGKILYESPAIKNVLGYEIEELEGTQSFTILHPEDEQKRREIIKKILAEPGLTINEILRFKDKKGIWHYVETVNTLIEDESNNLKGILVNSRDITKRKQDEERLQNYMEKLQRSNRELQDFAYIASHDLQEPLRKVQAFGDRLNKKFGDKLEGEGQDYIRRMQDAATRMQSLIEGLLTYSRVSTKAQPFVETDLKSICDEVISDLEVRIEQRKATITIENLPKIEADSLQMRQLFQNLISNALKFQNEGTNPIIKIFSEQSDNGDKFRIYVEDNGIGFEEKYLDKIFGVFQRLHGRSEYEGSGIGLSVCKKIVERHGGEITAKSSLGVGTTFIISLPKRNNESFYNSCSQISIEE